MGYCATRRGLRSPLAPIKPKYHHTIRNCEVVRYIIRMHPENDTIYQKVDRRPLISIGSRSTLRRSSMIVRSI